MLCSRLSCSRQGRAAARSGFPGASVVEYRRRCRQGKNRGCSRHRAHCRGRAVSHGVGHRAGDGTLAGFQDKVQIDPSEEGKYSCGSERRIFQTGPLTFGIAICHEGWRYPETVRWAARRGAQVVFTRTSTKPNRVTMRRPPLPIPRIRFTRKRCCAAPRTPATSQP